MSQLPRAGYVCSACGDEGNHWRVNCPLVRAQGAPHLHGSKKSKFFTVGGRQSETGTVRWDRHHKPKPKEGEQGYSKSAPIDEPAAPTADAAWSPADLDSFPMRASCLQQNVMVADLSAALQLRVWAYVAHMVMPQNAELPLALAACAALTPTALRLKELAESIEAFAVVDAFLCAAKREGRPVDLIADCACGHGLVGILLAYRFPQAEVVCVDLFKRDTFDQVVAAFRSHAFKLPGWHTPLQNLSFMTGRLDCPEIRAKLGPRAMVVALHACVEANACAVAMAEQCNSMWAIMPCCMRTKMCAPAGCQLLRCQDETRFLLLCGALAAKHGAAVIASVDRRITNRNIVICGPTVPESSSANYMLQNHRKPGKLKPKYRDPYQVRSTAGDQSEDVIAGDTSG